MASKTSAAIAGEFNEEDSSKGDLTHSDSSFAKTFPSAQILFQI